MPRATELNLKVGDVISDGRYSWIVGKDSDGFYIRNGNTWHPISRASGDDWEIMVRESSAELGEPVKITELTPGDLVLVIDRHGMWSQGVLTAQRVIRCVNPNGSFALASDTFASDHDYIIYRDPRPMPTLPAPPEKLSLREQIQGAILGEVRSMSTESFNRIVESVAMIPEIASLLEAEQ